MPGPLVHTPATPRVARASFDERAVHVWRARLDVPAASAARLEQCLAPAESDRGPNRRMSRAILRHLLAGYVGADPAGLRFEGESDRKPELTGRPKGEALHFNLTHSADLLLVALAPTPHLGVDAERVRPLRRADAIARRVFSEGERSRMEALPPARRTDAFFNCWTRK